MSKQQFETQLYLPGPIILAGNGAECARLNVCIRRAEQRSVAEVECLCPELQVPPLSKSDVLEHREIQVSRPVLAQIGMSSRQIPKGVVSRNPELRCIEPAGDRTIFNPSIPTYCIRPLITAEGEAVVRRLTEDQRLAGIQRKYTVRLPASQKRVGQPVHSRAEALAFAERQFVIEVEYKPVRDIVGTE